jgi:hypothetical protein
VLKHAFTLATATLMVLSIAAAAAEGQSCDHGLWTCSSDSSGTRLDISATETRPGNQGSSNTSNNNSNNSNSNNWSPNQGGGAPAEPEFEREYYEVNYPNGAPGDNLCTTDRLCDVNLLTPEEEEQQEADEAVEPVASVDDITLEDLASFRPVTPDLTGEPLGFGVVGAPTNRIASAETHEFPATILGLNVTVRFVPEQYTFDNGDGTSITTSTGGTTWDAIDAAQFAPTDTTHTYREPGDYDIGLTVDYAPYVTLNPAGSWLRVPGYITATAPTYSIQVVEAHTALVDQTCIENPRGPGC